MRTAEGIAALRAVPRLTVLATSIVLSDALTVAVEVKEAVQAVLQARRGRRAPARNR